MKVFAPVFTSVNLKQGSFKWLLLKPGPGPWTRTLKNLDSKALDSEKTGP